MNILNCLFINKLFDVYHYQNVVLELNVFYIYSSNMYLSTLGWNSMNNLSNKQIKTLEFILSSWNYF